MSTLVKLFRYAKDNAIRFALTRNDGSTIDLGQAPVGRLTALLESVDPIAELNALAGPDAAPVDLTRLQPLPPLEHHEVWAAGVTYLRSRSARMDESDFSASAYERVYEADRPELFFKALPQKVVGPGEPVGIRHDAHWSVPEPELALVLNSQGQIVAYTIGNDMSSRDIEGANLLYLPQAKTYSRSCALGPCLVLGPTEDEARSWTIGLEILRHEATVFSGQTSVSQIKRSFRELGEFLFRCQSFPSGAVLLTGTGIVPPNDFSLLDGDRVRIAISGIGTLENPVVQV
jgi:2-dehydro-3-deoxy-D-arabinonate dehydratase